MTKNQQVNHTKIAEQRASVLTDLDGEGDVTPELRLSGTKYRKFSFGGLSEIRVEFQGYFQ